MCYKETLLQVTGHQGSKVESREGERESEREREREREMKEGRERVPKCNWPWVCH